ncbi:hypothetical protein HXX01_03035 [Candidatus Nomurabacteria bacterium]|nr:hypothetical protein [Candidatus Nomurabacteria bacterium]
MLELFFLTLVSFLTRKKLVEEEKIPDDFVVEKDLDDYNVNSIIVELHQIVGSKASAEFITGDELVKQMKEFSPLGKKSRDYYFKHQDRIPSEFKNQVNLFPDTIFKDKDGKRFIPSLSYHKLRDVWSADYFCLSDRVNLKHNCVPIFQGNVSN